VKWEYFLQAGQVDTKGREKSQYAVSNERTHLTQLGPNSMGASSPPVPHTNHCECGTECHLGSILECDPSKNHP
jgi:hypothetical protein